MCKGFELYVCHTESGQTDHSLMAVPLLPPGLNFCEPLTLYAALQTALVRSSTAANFTSYYNI